MAAYQVADDVWMVAALQEVDFVFDGGNAGIALLDGDAFEGDWLAGLGV